MFFIEIYFKFICCCDFVLYKINSQLLNVLKLPKGLFENNSFKSKIIINFNIKNSKSLIKFAE